MSTLGQIISNKPQGNTLGSVLGKPTAMPFESTSLGIGINTVLGIPSAFKQVVTDVGQSIARSAGSAGLTFAKPFGGVDTLSSKDIQSPIGKKLFLSAFGNKPLSAVEDRIAKAELDIKNNPTAKKIGADKYALPLAFAGIMGGEALDLTPFGGLEKNVSKQLLKTISEQEALGILKNMGIEDSIAKVFAPRFAATKTPQEVKDGLDLMKQTIGMKAITQATTQTTEKVAQQTTGGMKQTVTPPTMSGAFSEISGKTIPETTPTGTKTLGQIIKTSSENIPQKDTLINLSRLSVGDTAAGKLLSTIEEIRPSLEKAKGSPLTHSEVLKAAQESSILSKGTSREATLKSEAALLKTRQNLAAMAEGKGVTKDFIDQLKIVSAEASRRGRELNALGISADPIENTTKAEIVKKLINVGIETDKIIKAAEGVDFNNLKQVTNFYRTFIKPTKTEWLDEYRYINLLSSPRTHIVNAFSNLIQGTVLNPATRLATGQVDFIISALTGKERAVYAKEVAPYYRGFINAIPDASRSFMQAMKGNIFIERPDINRIPTGSRILRPFQVIPRVLEASDVFFRSLITEGERQAIASRLHSQGKEITQGTLQIIDQQARDKAEYFVFRKALDPSNKTGQGHLLSTIDKLTSSIYSLRKIPGIKWFIPFVQTPMNILKQGIEYSPLGIGTLPGAINKAEQIGKAMIGSTVLLGAASLGMQGKLTWAIPSGAKEKDTFYNSGRQPYSVKIGDNWVSFSKLGPLAYPLAMAASIQWYMNENPQSVGQSTFERTTNTLNGIAQFFTDQSYLQGMQSLLEFTSGNTRLSGFQSVFSSNVGQIIPLSSLQRWTTHLIDPIYRKPDSAFNLKNLLQSIQKDIPGISTGVPRIQGSLLRPNPVVNALSPVQINPVNQHYENKLQSIRKTEKMNARLQAIKNKIKK